MRWLVMVALLSAVASADEGAPLEVHGQLVGTVAHLSARYRLAFTTAGTYEVELALPARGVVTAASATIDGQRHPLQLDRSTATEAAYSAILGAGASQKRRWVAELSVSFDGVVVRLAAAHGGTVTIDLELASETCFHDDVRYAQIPESWFERVRDTAAKRDSTDPCTGRALDPDSDGTRAWLTFPTQEASMKPFGEQRITASAGRLDLPHGHFARVELALAKQLTQVAPDLYTVFVIDASRSVTARELEIQAKLIESYARQAKSSRLQIVAYARKARALFPGWLVATRADSIARALEHLTVANGSNIDAGLAMADALLSEVTGTRRIVVLSDQRVADRVRALRPAVGASTLVHAIALDEESHHRESVERDDTVLFAELARTTQGLAATAHASPDDTVDALRLVRPIELEQVKLEAPGWKRDRFAAMASECAADGVDALREGVSCTWWGTAAVAAGGAKLTGLLWNHPIARNIVPTDRAESIAQMLSDTDDTLLGDANHEVLAAAHAINREWSMIAQWGGNGGYPDLDPASGVGMSGCGCGGGSQSTFGFGRGPGIRISHATFAEQIERGIAACHARSISISVELTLDEIVDVNVTGPEADCVTEAVWAIPLALADPKPHQTLVYSLAP